MTDGIQDARSSMELVKSLALESMGTIIEGKIEQLNDEAATPVLKRLLNYVELFKEADESYYEVMNLIVNQETALLDKLGYSYKKNPDGSIEYYSASFKEDSGKIPLTEKAYYQVISQVRSNLREHGIPKEHAETYNRMKKILSKLLDEETHFGLSMSQARPYLSLVEGSFFTTQYYSNIQLLISLKSIIEASY